MRTFSACNIFLNVCRACRLTTHQAYILVLILYTFRKSFQFFSFVKVLCKYSCRKIFLSSCKVKTNTQVNLEAQTFSSSRETQTSNRSKRTNTKVPCIYIQRPKEPKTCSSCSSRERDREEAEIKAGPINDVVVVESIAIYKKRANQGKRRSRRRYKSGISRENTVNSVVSASKG